MIYIVTSRLWAPRLLTSNLKISGGWNSLIGANGYWSLFQKLRDPDDLRQERRKSTKTGLIFDNSMVEHKCLWDPKYPESPERFSSVFNRMKQLGLIERCHTLKSRPATKKEILYIHTEDHYEKMKVSESISDPIELEELSSKYDAVFFHPKTNELALLAAGSTIELIDAVLNDEVRNGFAVIRPPGHHAFADKPCGYCFYNNVAIGAVHAIKQHGLERVLIVDWDVHHGQATQFSFEEQDEVMYFSIHKYLHGSFWPELIESNYTSIGRGPGKGYNINVPLNEEGLTDSDYLAIFHNILLPLTYEYNPQLIIISAGYDAAMGCPEGNMLLTPSLYAHLTNQLMTFANGKVCAILEGGYCLTSLADGAALTLRALLGDPCPPLSHSNEPTKLHKAMVDSILDVIWSLKPQWKSLRTQEEFDDSVKAEEDDTNLLIRKHYPVVEYFGKSSLSDPPSKYETRDCYAEHDKETAKKFELMLKQERESTDLTFPADRTCIKFDVDMNLHRRQKSEHQECPERIVSIYNGLKKEGLLDKCILIDSKRSATDDELRLAHSDAYLTKIKQLEHMNQDQVKAFAHTFDSIYMCKETNEAARLSAGALLQVTDSVLTNSTRNGFAIIRPPGHHAARDAAAGFCIFNNVAVAAEYAIKKYGLKRVLIVDWDVHHGDGTQSIFENHPNVLFISLHRYDFATFYPSSIKSGLKSESNIINIPWSGGPMSNSDYLLAFANIILPVAYEYNPEVVFVSAGFDAAKNDPLGEYKLDPEVFGHFTHLLGGLARGKLILALEGGYNIDAITKSAIDCVSVLLGEPPKTLAKTDINDNARTTIRDVMGYHSSNFSSLAFYAQLPKNKLVD